MVNPIVLVILDGWGYSPEKRGNAIASAQTPAIKEIESYFPFTLLQASGISVGLPWNEPGNSEVGHMNMGTGSIRYQPLTRINKSVLDGTFFKNPTLLKVASHLRASGGALHLMGLFGSGSVHSYRDHLFALLEFARHEELSPVFVHLFLDGRDSPPREGATLVQELKERLAHSNEGYISTVIGRHFALDRDNRWDLTKEAYDLLVSGKGSVTNDVVESINKSYEAGVYDEFVKPLLANTQEVGRPGTVLDGDAVVFYDFREDSARQLTYAFVRPERTSKLSLLEFKNLLFVSMTLYDETLKNDVILPPLEARNTVSELVSLQGWKQFKIAETEKYAHVTYFFNGGREAAFWGEERKLIPSLRATSYADDPEMKALEISAEVVRAIESREYRLLVANFANADMVSHTGNLAATVKGVEAIDRALAPIIRSTLDCGGALIITADHGHAEVMLDIRRGTVVTEHSTNPVPLYLIDERVRRARTEEERQRSYTTVGGILADVAATLIDLLEIPMPAEIEGKSLLPTLFDS